MPTLRCAALAALILLASTSAQAFIITYGGQDDGAAVGGPFANSLAARTAFLAQAATHGPVATETFEGQALGYYSPIVIAGGSIAYTSPDFGPGFSGISNTTNGNLYGFNTTPGGSQWFGFPDFNPSAATFTFAKPTYSFGFFTTGIQTSLTATLSVTQADGSAQTFNLPLNVNGGVSFFGLVDTAGFTSVSILNVGVPGSGDAWGVDDVSYNLAVPEPASWALLLGGFGLLGGAVRRRRLMAVAVA